MENQTQKPIEEIRQEKITKLKTLREKGVHPYPSRLEFNVEPIEHVRKVDLDTKVAVAGRIQSIRGHGGIRFVDLHDPSGQIQTAIKLDTLGAEKMDLFKLIDPGDFLEVTGSLFQTKTGELTILVDDYRLLSKAIRPIPDKREGLKDKELRYRKRYLDLILNENTQRIFQIRHQITRKMRLFLDDFGLTEVETPVLQPLYGGANAKPFTTHINALDSDAYLRIASELYLKRLMTAQFKGVYDIAKDFRNEGVDQTHFPEFTMMEVYLSYSDYHSMMDLMENMLRFLSREILTTTTIEVHDQEINLDQEWPRIPMTELIKNQLGIDVISLNKDEILNHKVDESSIRELLQDKKIDLQKLSKGELIFTVFDKLVKITDPTWVIDYPTEVSPLSKQHPDKPGFVERFELYVGGKEIMDGWSEINDPLMQKERFLAEQERSFGETETAQPIDEDYIEAMEYGMPPMSGVGVGIDRLTMFFTNEWSIQETILFPFKKPSS